MPDLDLELVRRLLAQRAAGFCRVPQVSGALEAGPGEHLEALRGYVTQALPGRYDGTTGADLREGERALFSAIALAVAGDAAGLELLRDPHRYFCTSSCVEVALAMVARLLLGDLQPPLSFINASLLGELATAVGAYPPRR